MYASFARRDNTPVKAPRTATWITVVEDKGSDIWRNFLCNKKLDPHTGKLHSQNEAMPEIVLSIPK